MVSHETYIVRSNVSEDTGLCVCVCDSDLCSVVTSCVCQRSK
jgi:hypothetical protein